MTAREISFETKSKVARCRSCRCDGLLPVLDLGDMPLADGLVSREQLDRPEEKYPLEVVFCPSCSLLQILETVQPERLFGHDYPYYSSFSDALLAHSRDNALELIDRQKLNGKSLVLEIASNDGYLLKNFVQAGVPVQGIDPAPGPAKVAEKSGVPTMCSFFGKELAEKLRAEGNQADVIIANNVLAHVADTNGMVEGIRIILKNNGTTSIEVPYVRDLIEHCEFDTIYHEHLCYFSVTALDKLFRRHGLFLNRIKQLPIHGGSIRLYASPRDERDESVTQLLAEEKQRGIDRYDYYKDFAQRVQQIRSSLRELVSQIKLQGKRIAAYGAAAKGATLVNYVGIGSQEIDFVVDRNTHKQGKFMPGVRIPICDPQRLAGDMPEFTLLLPWNFKDEILRQQQTYRDRGGKFIIPIPSPQVV